ncbi:uncharacterized protein B0H64DRAFT_395608 [Chaetomium fimeti]|uniref:Secreted protein n=1 Tax=Chaetomium fimeti TaxID=1854472 RepID=A0AAE0HH31_9PEZI|nr:hypothetical protein B0H64DRAFT_395608 [Chaetomium fimeti]
MLVSFLVEILPSIALGVPAVDRDTRRTSGENHSRQESSRFIESRKEPFSSMSCLCRIAPYYVVEFKVLTLILVSKSSGTE